MFAAPTESSMMDTSATATTPCPRCGQPVAEYASLCQCGFDMEAWRKKDKEERHRLEMEQQAEELEERSRREEIARLHKEESDETERSKRGGIFSRLQRKK